MTRIQALAAELKDISSRIAAIPVEPVPEKTLKALEKWLKSAVKEDMLLSGTVSELDIPKDITKGFTKWQIKDALESAGKHTNLSKARAWSINAMGNSFGIEIKG